MSDGAPQSTERPAKEGRIYDLGYRSYTGTRLGRWYAFRSLFFQGLKNTFGIGRETRAKVGPFLLLGLSTLPAVIAVAAAGATGNMVQLMTHDRYFASTAWLFALFCAGQAPELVGGDQQHRVLPLYFSRALRRGDYVAARLLALVAALLLISLLPQLVLFFGRAFVNENPWTLIRSDFHLLLPIAAGALVISLLFGSIALMIAAATPRRLVATASIIAVMMLTLAAGSTLARTTEGPLRYTVLASPILVSEGVTGYFFDVTPRPRSPLGRSGVAGHVFLLTALGLSAASVAATSLRYRNLET